MRCFQVPESPSAPRRSDKTSANRDRYPHQPEQAPWGDHVVTARGEILYRHTFPDAVYSPVAVDLDGDGLNDLVLACHDGKVYRIPTRGKALSRSWPVVQANQRRAGHAPG